MERSLYKQRIVGGLVLVALGAIVIPFLLDMHQDDEWWGKGNIPKKPEDGFVTRVLPLQEWSKQAQSELTQAGTQVDDAAAAIKEQVEAPPAASPQAPAPKPAPSASPAATAGAEGWVVQLGSFANRKNAEDLDQRLRQKGYRVFVDQVRQGGQTVYRVRVGPEQQRAAADSLHDRLGQDLNLKGIVLHIP